MPFAKTQINIAKFFAVLILTLLFNSRLLGAADWSEWKGTKLPQIDWSVRELREWNLARMFSCSCNVKYLSEESLLKVDGESGLFGVEIVWPHELGQGYAYKFVVPVSNVPDFILLDDELVWEKKPGVDYGKNIEFTYFPKKEKKGFPKIYIVKRADGKDFNFPDCKQWGFLRMGFKCLRQISEAQRPEYKKFKLPTDLKFQGNDISKSLSHIPHYGKFPVEYKKAKLNPPANASSDSVFFEYLPIKGHLGNDGINGYIISMGLKLPDLARQFDIDLLLPLLKEEKINNLCYFGPFYGRFILKPGKFPLHMAHLKKMADAFLPQDPSNMLYIFLPEVDGRNFGKWEDGFNVKNSIFLKKAKADLTGLSLPDIYKLAASKQREFYDNIKKDVGYPDRFKIIFQAHDALFELNSFYAAGADIIINKNIGRQCLNLVTSNMRGAALSEGKEYGFEADCWFGWNFHNYSPGEFEDNWKVYFMSGGKYFLAEASTACPGLENTLSKAPTELGVVWLDFVRWARMHPKRGEQKCRIALMRSYGKEHKGGYKGGMDEEHRNVLEILFPRFGDSRTTRLSTGTPYGPVDIIPFYTKPDILKKYDLIIFLGTKGFDMNKEAYNNLKVFVENGGELIAPVGQMRKDNGELVKKDMKDLFGVELFDVGNLCKKNLKSKSRGKSALWCGRSGKPLGIIESKLGRGKTTLVLGEYLDARPKSPTRKLICDKLEKAKWLEFSPASDWLEYMVQKKDSCFIVPVFNHGNVGFPSGNGKKTGPWEGEIVLDLSKFKFSTDKLEVYESICETEGQECFKLIPIKSQVKDGSLSFKVKVDKFSEIVVGPEGETKGLYFK
jgi:hypothetical protein